jgi:acyl-CoA reductase-like NAD-dependent aldehyde dehydrogenase
MGAMQKTITPIDGSLYVERPYNSAAEIAAALAAARTAAKAWRGVPVAERARLLSKAADAFVSHKEPIAEEITRQIGRPLGQSPGEVRGFEERARYMIEVASSALADIDVGAKEGFNRFIRREPLGVVFVVAPWNFPYLTAVNAVVPALMAGNAVLLKHSAQTPLCAERFAEAFKAAGLPQGLFQHLVLTHEDTSKLIGTEGIDYVAFTGSVAGGHAVVAAASKRFIGLGLELGGCDPAYVRADATLAHAVENLVDGAFFNSGQSCCGIQRIYVHKDVYKDFVEGAVALTEKYNLGNPLESGVNLGPVVRAKAADEIRGQVAKSVKAGARAVVDATKFKADQPGTAYVSRRRSWSISIRPIPSCRRNASAPSPHHARRLDEEAIRLMNDNAYGLTAAIWTNDERRRSASATREIPEPDSLNAATISTRRWLGSASRIPAAAAP